MNKEKKEKSKLLEVETAFMLILPKNGRKVEIVTKVGGVKLDRIATLSDMLRMLCEAKIMLGGIAQEIAKEEFKAQQILLKAQGEKNV
jgi:helix-turn-helix protein